MTTMGEIKGLKFKIVFGVIVFMYLAVIALNYNRLHYGIDLTDEGFYVAEAYLVSNGAIPVTNMWTQVPGVTLLYFPLVSLFTAITGGTEGIFLFMRQTFLIYKILVAALLFILFKRKFPPLLSLLLPLPYLALSIASIDNFSYNTLSIPLLLISCVVLFFSLSEGEGRNKPFAVMGGVSMALTVLAHPAQVFTAAYVLLLLAIFERKRFKTWFRSCLYMAGGLLTAVVVILYLTIISGGFRPVFEGVINVLQTPYFDLLGQRGPSFHIDQLIRTLEVFRNFIIPGILVFLGIFALSRISRPLRCDTKTVYVIALFFAQLLNIAIIVYRYSNYRHVPPDISICHAYIIILFLFAIDRKGHTMAILLVFSPFLVNYLLNIPFNAGGLHGRGYILLPSVMLCILFTYYSLDRVLLPKWISAKKTIITYVCVIALTAAVSAAFTISYYGFVYRDAPISELTYRVERGVFKGLHTDEERGSAIVFLEDEIRRLTDEKEKVMFQVHMPAAYLMTQAMHCTPITWYNPVTNGDAPFFAYFSKTGNEPDKIIYVHNHVRDEEDLFLNWQSDDYRFGQYIGRYFTQTYANDAEQFAIVVYERNP